MTERYRSTRRVAEALAHCAYGVAVAIVVAVACGMFSPLTTLAAAPERPSVELVKTFSCWATGGSCPETIEQEANAWLQAIQPGAHIVARHVAASEQRFVIAIFYEVPEWRTPKAALPAERPAEKR